MVFKKCIPIFFVLLFLISCKRDPEAEHELCIINATQDTLFFTEKMSSNRDYTLFLPYEKRRLAGSYNRSSALDILRELYQYLDIEIELYKLACDTCEGMEILEINSRKPYLIGDCLVAWLPPVVTLHDSIHSFYNTNSWVVKKGGRKNKWDSATFTITENDLKGN